MLCSIVIATLSLKSTKDAPQDTTFVDEFASHDHLDIAYHLAEAGLECLILAGGSSRSLWRFDGTYVCRGRI